MKKVGFIGLGIMGSPMAVNLLKAGVDLLVDDHHADRVEAVVRAGAQAAKRSEIGRTCETVFTMLPDGPQVKEAVLGEGGLLDFLRPGSTVIDMSSINPKVTREIARKLEEQGIEMLDAPVSGGETGAVAGTLSFMVGGRPEAFEKCRSLLLTMGESAVLCGGPGAGGVVKLANQIMVAANIAGCSEAFMLAKMAGVDLEKAFEAVRGGLAGSRVLETKVPAMLAGDFTPGFRMELHSKDLRNALEYAHFCGAPVPLTAQFQEMMTNLCAQGCEKEDHSGMVKYYARLSGTDLAGGRAFEEERWNKKDII